MAAAITIFVNNIKITQYNMQRFIIISSIYFIVNK